MQATKTVAKDDNVQHFDRFVYHDAFVANAYRRTLVFQMRSFLSVAEEGRYCYTFLSMFFDVFRRLYTTIRAFSWISFVRSFLVAVVHVTAAGFNLN